jgi:hypothetical protein
MLGEFLQLFMSFPGMLYFNIPTPNRMLTYRGKKETVADLILDIRERPPAQRRGHCSLHFDHFRDLEKWIRVLKSQESVEKSRLIARCVFYPEEKRNRLMDALVRGAAARVWKDNHARAAFEKYFKDSMYWDDDEGIMNQFRASGGVDLGPCGVVLGVSCIVNQVDRTQTNMLMSLPISQPPVAAGERGARRPIVMVCALDSIRNAQCLTFALARRCQVSTHCSQGSQHQYHKCTFFVDVNIFVIPIGVVVMPVRGFGKSWS